MTSKTGNNAKYQVLITGACGYIGQRLMSFLLDKSINIIATDLLNRFSDEIKEKSKSLFTFIPGDLLVALSKAEELINSSKGNTQTIVVHLAGKSHVGDCQQNPYSAFFTNVTLTANMLEFCRKNKINKLIFPSTGLVYGTAEKKSVKESSALSPDNIYAANKLSAEEIIKGYSKSYDLKSVILRFSNIYGPEGNPDTVVQTILKQILNRNEKILFHSGRPVRDFIYINDVVSAIYALIIFQIKNNYEIFNVSSGTGVSILDLAKTACKVAGIPNESLEETNNNSQNSYLVLDNQLIKNTTGWNPEYSLFDGLSEIINGKLDS